MLAVGAFVRLSRLKFLLGGLIGGALGTAVAFYEHGSFSLAAYALAQFAITSAHLMTQYANEYYDRESDSLTTRTKFSGGSGVLVEGALPARVAILAALVCLAGSCAGTIALAATGHRLAALFAALCACFAWAYSAPPFRLLARGLGEIDTSLVVAIFVPLCAYAAQTGTVDLLALAATLPGAAAMFAMMICVQVPDIVADTATQKRNLVVRLGLRRSATFGVTASVLAVGAIVVAVTFGAPASYAAIQALAIGPIVWLAIGLLRLRAGRKISVEGLARRGVLAFSLVGLFGAIGFAGAPYFH